MCMTTQDLGSLAVALLLLVLGANLLGQLFARFRQPRVVGEILAGVLVGPSLLGHFAPGTAADLFGDGSQDPSSAVLGFLYHLGLLLLMFVSGSSVHHVLGKENRKPTAFILAIGTPLPFLVVLLLAPVLPLDGFIGPVGSRPALVLVFAIAVAVTSIPVITKIFYDLGILHTRFASLMLGTAVLEDILLWAVLAVATAIASATVTAGGGSLAETVSVHVVANVAYIAAAMTVAPMLLRWLGRARWNTLATRSPIAWVMTVVLGYVAVAATMDVTLVFAAFLAGFGIAGGTKATERQRFQLPLESLNQVSAAVFIPVYFAIVGYRLDFTKSFSPLMLAGFLVGSSAAALLSKGPGRPAGRLPRSGHHQPGDNLQRPRRTGNRPGQRGLRRWHHQCQLLHHPGADRRAHLPGLWVLARLRPAQGMAAAEGRGPGPQHGQAATGARPRPSRVGTSRPPPAWTPRARRPLNYADSGVSGATGLRGTWMW
jgi:Kef-type K+ transport system membrane component KefB